MKSPSNPWTKRRPGILIPVFFLSLFQGCFAQLYQTDARSLGLAGCYTTSTTGAVGLLNEAGLGYEGPVILNLSHARPFFSSSLGVTSAGLQFPLYPGNMNLQLQQYGIPGFRYFSSALGFGMKLSENIHAGAGFRYYSAFTRGEDRNLWTLGISGGMIIRTGEHTLLAFHLINPVTAGNHPTYGPVFPAMVTIGIGKRVYEATTVWSELSYSSETALQFRLAAEYIIDERVQLRMGYHTHPVSVSFGSGIDFLPLSTAIACTWSVTTGITPALSITYTPGR